MTKEYIKVKTDILNPRMMSSFEHGFEVNVVDEFHILIDQKKFILSDSILLLISNHSSKIPEKLWCFLNDKNIVVELIEKRNERSKDLDELVKDNKIIIENKKFLNNIKFQEFFAKFSSLPFKWNVDHKEVLSGLSINSLGNGMRKNSVFHFRLEEDISLSNLKRQKYDFLCSKNYKNGNWTLSDGNRPYDHNHVVSCKTCIKFAERILKKSLNLRNS